MRLKISTVLKIVLLFCSIYTRSVAAAELACPAHRLDTTTDDPQGVLLNYIAQSSQLSAELGLATSFDGMGFNELMSLALPAREAPPIPVLSLGPNLLGNTGRGTGFSELRSALASVADGTVDQLPLSAEDISDLHQLSVNDGSVAATLNGLVGQKVANDTFLVSREGVVRTAHGATVGDDVSSASTLPFLDFAGLERVVLPGDFEDTISEPKPFPSGRNPKPSGYADQCKGPAKKVAEYVNFKNSPPDVINSLFNSPWNKSVVVDNSTLDYLNKVNNFDACCLSSIERLKDVDEVIYHQILKNTGTVIEADDGGQMIARGSATLISEGILVTARHVVEDLPLDNIFFSFTGTSTRLDKVVKVKLGRQIYQGSDIPNDYAFLFVEVPTSDGIPVLSRPSVGLQLVVAAFNKLSYQSQTLFQRVAQVVPSVPAWRRATRWDAHGHCEVKQLMEIDGVPDACFQHGCQSESGTSGAGLFAVSSEGTLSLVGIHVAPVSQKLNRCEPTLKNRGNIGITLNANEIESAILEK